MAKNKEIRNVAIVGTGVIGASWATYYLSRGFNVVATDPAPNAEANLRKYVDAAWTTLSKNGMAPSASRDRLTFEPKMAQALAKADFVQENGPERPDFKTKLFAEIDDATPPDSILASSSSGITMDVIQSACKRPERCVIGHPFNPPHVIPLVEVVGGAKTSPQTIEKFCRGERDRDGTPKQSRERWSLTFALNDIENTTRRFVYEYDNFNNDQRRG